MMTVAIHCLTVVNTTGRHLTLLHPGLITRKYAAVARCSVDWAELGRITFSWEDWDGE